MVKLVLLGRFGLAEGMLNCAEHLVGHQQGVYSLDSKPGDNEEMFGREIEQILNNVSGSKIVLVDYALGPIPEQCIRLSRTPEIRVVTGYNLAMLLGLLESRKQEVDLDRLAAIAIQVGCQSIRMLD
jgi:mannose/fructose-specific phosphotransferase system component IIA